MKRPPEDTGPYQPNKVRTFFGKTLARISLTDGKVEVVGAINQGHYGEITFLNDEVYLAKDKVLRRIKLPK